MVAIESIKGTLELFHHQLLRIAWSFPFYGLDGCVSWQSYLFAVLRVEQEQSHGRGSRPQPAPPSALGGSTILGGPLSVVP